MRRLVDRQEGVEGAGASKCSVTRPQNVGVSSLKDQQRDAGA